MGMRGRICIKRATLRGAARCREEIQAGYGFGYKMEYLWLSGDGARPNAGTSMAQGCP
ncbi:hypothetical protein EM595_p0113 (plasmid) [Duffyella gerundensis]|uniref:Uncharacterized protein n=1 Tax=Duffyella gerundensis TaxID=1619313 RepID=A0A0U5L9K3_9GAMM|nr:hypothetical protein EM595_p0113 [Duffyella gerundensis]